MSQSRRDFLLRTSQIGGGLLLADWLQLMQIMTSGTIRNAYAETAGHMPKNYIYYHMGGGPPRFLFDHLLAPNPTDTPLSAANASTWNDGIATAFSGGQYLYNVINYKGIMIPHHLAYNVATSDGGARPLSDIFNNIAIIRGINSRTDGHEANAPLHMFPDPAQGSLNGLVADGRQDSIASIAASFSARPFNSIGGKTMYTIDDHSGSAGSIGGLMKSFSGYVPVNSGLKNLSMVKGTRQFFSDVMKAHAQSLDKNSAALEDHAKSTSKLIELAAEDLATTWSTLYNKYLTIVKRSANIFEMYPSGIPGLGDAAISIGAVEPNLLDTFAVDRDYDLRLGLQAPAFNLQANIARSFAIAEYCLTRNISGSIAVGSNSVCENIRLYGTPSGGSLGFNNIGLGSDQHIVPVKIGLLYGAAYYRGFGAALLEFIRVLKSVNRNGKNLFDDSVIHISGDFARNPRNDKVGSDHGWDGQVVSMISGAINGPIVVGNIKGTGKSGYNGAWGLGSEVDFNGSKELVSLRHVAAAIASVLDIRPHPWTFTNLVLKNENGSVVPKIGAKIT